MTVSVVQGPVSGEPGGGLSFWRRALRAGITFIILPALAFAIAFTCVKVVAQSDQWDLPGGRLLDTVLSSCQFEHSSSAGGDVEHMICPTRLSAGEFPQVLKDAVVASEDERFFSHGALEMRSTARAAWAPVPLTAWRMACSSSSSAPSMPRRSRAGSAAGT